MNENLKKMYWQKWLLTLLAILMFSIGSFAQESRSISGKVTDSGGGSIPGVSVSVKGQTVGTITDGDGPVIR